MIRKLESIVIHIKDPCNWMYILIIFMLIFIYFIIMDDIILGSDAQKDLKYVIGKSKV